MINVQLYNALVRIFKDVRISNEGDAAVFAAPRLTAMQNNLKNKHKDRRDLMPQRVYGGEQYHVCCPYCGDERYRLYISHTWDRHLNNKDGTKIYAGKRALCQNENCLTDSANFRDLDTKIKANLKGADQTPLECSTDVEAFQDKVIKLPPVHALADYPLIQEYVMQRGFNVQEMVNNWFTRVAQIWFYPSPVLIFPIYQNGILKAWQARYPKEDYKALGKPKYYWPSGVKKSWLLYNMDMAKLYRVVVVTEGILDVMKVGAPGVALFGKIPSPRQEALLSTHWKNSILLWLPDTDDPKSIEAAESYTAKWNRNGVFQGGSHVVRLTGGDPGDHSRRILWNTMLEQVPSLSGYVDVPTLLGYGTAEPTPR